MPPIIHFSISSVSRNYISLKCFKQLLAGVFRKETAGQSQKALLYILALGSVSNASKPVACISTIRGLHFAI